MSSGDDLVGAHNGAAAHQGTTDSAGEHDLYNSGEDQEDGGLGDEKSCNELLEKRRVEKISWHYLHDGEDRQDEDLDDEKDGNEQTGEANHDEKKR